MGCKSSKPVRVVPGVTIVVEEPLGEGEPLGEEPLGEGEPLGEEPLGVAIVDASLNLGGPGRNRSLALAAAATKSL